MFVELTELCLKLEQYKNMPDRKLLEKNYYLECSRVLEIYATFATRALFYQLNESVPQKIFPSGHT